MSVQQVRTIEYARSDLPLTRKQQGREKRPRSLVACEPCRKRRSRCEPAPVGPSCGKCQQLDSECSFTWIGPGLPGRGLGVAASDPLATPGHLPSLGNPDTTTPSNDVCQQSEVVVQPPVSDELAVLRVHVAYLQNELDKERSNRHCMVPNPHSSSHTLAEHSIRRLAADGRRKSIQNNTAIKPANQAVDYRGATDPETFSLVSRGMGDTQERGLVDPVSEGIVNMSQLETAFQV